jgi:hypothetical protein
MTRAPSVCSFRTAGPSLDVTLRELHVDARASVYHRILVALDTFHVFPAGAGQNERLGSR